MPQLISSSATDQVDLAECVERLSDVPFSLCQEDAVQHAADCLKRLGNNEDFLAEFVIQELKNRCQGQAQENDYSSQVIMLHKSTANFFMRANLWPAEHDYAVQTSGRGAFYYDLPHDHNFNFLTIGYAGPGYWSDYYEYDYSSVQGFVGESVELNFVETSQLELGKMLLYRAHKDVHCQRPPESLSVSINIMECEDHHDWLDQYGFDLDTGQITDIFTHVASEPLLKLAVHLVPEMGKELAEYFAARHPSDRMRSVAWKALGSAMKQPELRRAHLEKGMSHQTKLVREYCRGQLTQF